MGQTGAEAPQRKGGEEATVTSLPSTLLRQLTLKVAHLEIRADFPNRGTNTTSYPMVRRLHATSREKHTIGVQLGHRLPAPCISSYSVLGTAYSASRAKCHARIACAPHTQPVRPPTAHRQVDWLGVIRDWHDLMVLRHHPDHGGSKELMQELDAAAEAMKEMVHERLKAS
jgi:hypothetical protein